MVERARRQQVPAEVSRGRFRKVRRGVDRRVRGFGEQSIAGSASGSTSAGDATRCSRSNIGQIRAGWLTLVPHTSSWYEDHVGELFYREIEGDFVLSTSIEARSRNGLGAPGSMNGGSNDSEYSLVGLMLRAPRRELESGGPAAWQAGFERYVFYSFGSANIAGSYQTEVKTTRAATGGETHSVSLLQIDSVGCRPHRAPARAAR